MAPTYHQRKHLNPQFYKVQHKPLRDSLPTLPLVQEELLKALFEYTAEYFPSSIGESLIRTDTWKEGKKEQMSIDTVFWIDFSAQNMNQNLHMLRTELAAFSENQSRTRGDATNFSTDVRVEPPCVEGTSPQYKLVLEQTTRWISKTFFGAPNTNYQFNNYFLSLEEKNAALKNI